MFKEAYTSSNYTRSTKQKLEEMAMKHRGLMYKLLIILTHSQPNIQKCQNTELFIPLFAITPISLEPQHFFCFYFRLLFWGIAGLPSVLKPCINVLHPFRLAVLPFFFLRFSSVQSSQWYIHYVFSLHLG